MPIYEYECQKCGEINSFIENVGDDKFFLFKLFRRCKNCKSRKLKRILSTFSTSFSRTFSEQIDELRKMGPVQFVPQYPRPAGPPPGGCPYMQQEEKKDETIQKPPTPHKKKKKKFKSKPEGQPL